MRQAADTTGARPTPAAVARHLGLANTTFRRRFPHLVAELAAPTSDNQPSSSRPARTSYDQLNDDNAQLREHKRELTEHLEFAIAQLQRLTLDNHQLREQLEAERGITRLPRGAGDPPPK
jgi:predicted ArsR family transcriptional regulator